MGKCTVRDRTYGPTAAATKVDTLTTKRRASASMSSQMVTYITASGKMVSSTVKAPKYNLTMRCRKAFGRTARYRAAWKSQRPSE